MTPRLRRLPWPVRVCVSVLVAAYPRWVRRRYGAEMTECYADAWREASGERGRPPGIGYHARALSGLAANAFVAWFDTPTFLAERTWRRADASWSEGSTDADRRPSWPDLATTLRQAVRGLGRAPVFTAVTVATLALGIGATTTVFTAVDTVLLTALPYPQPDRLVSLAERSPAPAGRRSWVAEETFRDWQQRARTFRALAAWRLALATLNSGGQPERLSGYAVTSAYFDVMGIPMTLGRGFTADEDRPGAAKVVVLSHRLWLRRFAGQPGVVGSTVTIDRVPHTVVGVSGRRLDYPDRSEFWVPLALEYRPGYRAFRYLAVIGRLRPGVPLDGARADLGRVAAAIEHDAPDSNAGWGALVDPLDREIVGDLRPFLVGGLLAVALLLLVAVANVVNLFVARLTGRQEELAVRRALGAGPGRLLHLFVSEALVISGAGALGGLVAAWWGGHALGAAIQDYLPNAEPLAADGRAILFAVGVAVTIGLALGLLPAWLSPSASISDGLRAGARSVVSRARVRRLRTGLLVLQVALAVVLLVGAALFLRSLDRLRRTDPGFDPRHILTFDVDLPDGAYDDARRIAALDRLRAGIASLPGVDSVGTVFPMPMILGSVPFRMATPEMRSWPESQRPMAHLRTVSPGYFEAMRIPLVRGRYLRDDDRQGRAGVVVINQAFARHAFGTGNPIGQRVTFQEPGAPDAQWLTVVGVVGDVLFNRLWSEHQPEVYRSALQEPFYLARLVVRTRRDSPDLPRRLASVVRGVDPDIAVADLRSGESIVGEGLTLTRLTTALLGLFALVSAALALVGVLGVLSLTVAGRLREMGVRIVLGARPARVLALVVGSGMGPVAIGTVLGLAGAAAGSRLAASQLRGVSPFDAWAFAAAGASFLAVALLICLGPAVRAARVDPNQVLRSE